MITNLNIYFQVSNIPSINASASWGNIAVAVDSCLFIFGEECFTLRLQMQFESKIDAVVWLPQGNFLLIADRSGKINWVNIASQRVLISR